jgi:hypothetical protein
LLHTKDYEVLRFATFCTILLILISEEYAASIFMVEIQNSRNRQEVGSKQRSDYCLLHGFWLGSQRSDCCPFHVSFLLGLLASPEVVSDVAPRNIDCLSPDYMASYTRGQNSSADVLLAPKSKQNFSMKHIDCNV